MASLLWGWRWVHVIYFYVEIICTATNPQPKISGAVTKTHYLRVAGIITITKYGPVKNIVKASGQRPATFTSTSHECNSSKLSKASWSQHARVTEGTNQGNRKLTLGAEIDQIISIFLNRPQYAIVLYRQCLLTSYGSSQKCSGVGIAQSESRRARWKEMSVMVGWSHDHNSGAPLYWGRTDGKLVLVVPVILGARAIGWSCCCNSGGGVLGRLYVVWTGLGNSEGNVVGSLGSYHKKSAFVLIESSQAHINSLRPRGWERGWIRSAHNACRVLRGHNMDVWRGWGGGNFTTATTKPNYQSNNQNQAHNTTHNTSRNRPDIYVFRWFGGRGRCVAWRSTRWCRESGRLRSTCKTIQTQLTVFTKNTIPAAWARVTLKILSV